MEGRAEVRALSRGGIGPRAIAWGAFKCHQGLEGSALSPILNELWGADGPVWRPGNRVNLALGLGGPKTPALW